MSKYPLVRTFFGGSPLVDGETLPVHSSVSSSSLAFPLRVEPQIVDYGSLSLEPVLRKILGERNNVAIQFNATDSRLVRDEEVDAYHLFTGWNMPDEESLSEQLADLLLRKVEASFDFGALDNSLSIRYEITTKQLSGLEKEASPYDEVPHTDLTNSTIPVVQILWANKFHSLYSLQAAYIGESHENIASAAVPLPSGDTKSEVFNVLYLDANGAHTHATLKQFSDGHLLAGDARQMPHSKPRLSVPANVCLERILLRAFVSEQNPRIKEMAPVLSDVMAAERRRADSRPGYKQFAGHRRLESQRRGQSLL